MQSILAHTVPSQYCPKVEGTLEVVGMSWGYEVVQDCEVVGQSVHMNLVCPMVVEPLGCLLWLGISIHLKSLG